MERKASTTPVSSVRYQRLLECINTALEKCRNQVDIEKAIRMCYGDGDGNEVFCTMLENILQQFHVEINTEMAQYLQKENVEDKLIQLESIIRKVDHDIELKKQHAIDDKESAISAIQHAKLPSHISPQDVIQFQSYQKLMQEKQSILDEINMLQSEISNLQTEKSRYMDIADTNIQDMRTMKMELEQSADLCSLVK